MARSWHEERACGRSFESFRRLAAVRGGTELFKIDFIGKVKVLRRNKSPVFFRFPPDGFPPPAHLANFVAKWPSPPAPVIPTLENQYWFPSFSPHHYRFVSSLPRSPRSSISGRIPWGEFIRRQPAFFSTTKSTTSARRAFLVALLRNSHSCAPAIASEHPSATIDHSAVRGGPQTQRVWLR